MKIFITGVSGLFGLNFALHNAGQHQVVGVVNQNNLIHTPFEVIKADLSDFSLLDALIQDSSPDLILHCAALANVDACEKDPEKAHLINADLAGEMASISSRHGIRMVHFSTDAVFDGSKGNYTEEDDTNPINQYAKTKLAGEKQVSSANPDCLIVRVNFYGWSLSGTRSLAELFVSQLDAGKGMMGFTDVYFCPFHTLELSEIILHMVDQKLSGLYHVVSDECLSKYDFGCLVARKFGFDEGKIKPVSWRDAGLVANRSPKLTLNVDKLIGDIKITLPDQDSCLNSFYKLYLDDFPEKLRELLAG